jgi:hypothetical protein
MALSKRPAQDDSANMGGKKVRTVRGGGICQKSDKPALNRDTMQTMLCVSTPGADPRPRWSSPGAGSSKGSQGTRGSHGSHAHATTDYNPKNRVSRRQR